MNRQQKWLFVLLLLIAVVAPYWQTRSFDFVWDDVHFVSDNYGIRALTPLHRFFHDQTTLTSSRPEYREQIYRPMRTMAYALIYKFFGIEAPAFHLFNLLVYLSCVLLFFFVCLRFGLSPPVALLAALLFAWHPLHTEAVAWVSSLSELLAANFFLLALLFYYDQPQWPRPAWSKATALLLFFPAALFSKEISITLPAMLAVIWFAERHKLTSQERRQQLLWIGLGFVIALVYFFWRAQVLGQVAQTKFNADYSTLTLLNVPLTLALNLKLLLFPYPQNSFHPYYFSNVTTTTYWLGVGGSLLFIATLIWTWRRHRQLFTVLIILAISLTPILNLLAITIHIAERFLFLPSLIYCFAVALALQHWWQNSRMPKFAVGVGVAMLLAMLLLTLNRLPVWQNEARLFTDPLKQATPLPEAYENYGVLKQRQKIWPEAEWAFKKQLALIPNDPRPHNNLAALALVQKQWAVAAQHAERSIAISPKQGRAYDNLAIATANLGNANPLPLFEKAAALAPDDYNILTNLGIAYLNHGNLPAAISTFERCKTILPLKVSAYKWLMRSYAMANDRKNVEATFNALVAIAPQWRNRQNELMQAQD